MGIQNHRELERIRMPSSSVFPDSVIVNTVSKASSARRPGRATYRIRDLLPGVEGGALVFYLVGGGVDCVLQAEGIGLWIVGLFADCKRVGNDP